MRCPEFGYGCLDEAAGDGIEVDDVVLEGYRHNNVCSRVNRGKDAMSLICLW